MGPAFSQLPAVSSASGPSDCVAPQHLQQWFAATVWYPGTIVGARYPSGSSASSYAAIWAEGGSQIWTESQVPKLMATMQDNPDSALFTDCNAGAPAALSQYGVQALGSIAAPAIYNGVITHDQFIEWDVEFIARN